MTNERFGALIGAVFGLVYVWVNAGELPSAVSLTLRILGVAAFAGLVGVLVWRRNDPGKHGERPDRATFGSGYWAVVIAEAIALFGGLRIVNGPLDAPDTETG